MRSADLLGRFREVAPQADGGYLALCPAHADSDPSLRIWIGDDHKARLTCRAGCNTSDVLLRAGLEWSDLFDVSGDSLTVPKAAPMLAGEAERDGLAAYVYRAARQYFTSEVGDSAKEYARRRFGVDYELAMELDLGADVNGDFEHLSRSFKRYPRLIVPLFDFEGEPHGLQGRDLSGDCPARWVSLRNPKSQRWGQYGVFRGGGGYRVFVVTEGPGDALSACALGYDSVAVRGAALGGSETLIAELARGMADADRVIIAGDADTAGATFTRNLAEGLQKHGLAAYTLAMPGAAKDLTAWREAAPEAFPAEFHSAVGAAKPFATAQQRTRTELARRTGTDTVSATEGSDASTILAELVTQYGESDAMNAYALVAWSEGCIRYAPGLGFYVWNGHVWQQDDNKVRQQIHKMGAALVLAGKLHESRGFTMTTRIDALLTELRSVPNVRVRVDEFDSADHLLAFRNGTVDLRSGELRSHDKEDMLTCSLPIDYVPLAPCARWEAFLTEIFPSEPALVEFMQRLTGYGISGSTDEQCFTVLYGKGANGKSVFTDTLTSVFGPITKTTRFATFEQKATGAIPNDIANLRAARLVLSSEGGANKRMDEEGLKSLTGKDKVQARFLHKEWFEYRPKFLIMLATNHKPNFQSQDEGLWRRVKMVPFARYFAPNERDYDLDRKLKAEAEGIAAWTVRGAVKWYASGLQDPACIRNATQEFRETSDTLSGFYPGVVIEAAGERLNGTSAYIEYTSWCEEEGLKGGEVMRRTSFYRAMEERGVTKRKMAEGIVLEGVKLSKATSMGGPGIFSA